ncbi:Toll-like receptor 2 type-1 [Scophthalmus maximus]|uniref:Toll-like receptor 2 type-1 n=1 Tax=Scophthalmus maximus TaxID=52904 RepID=A0A2U9BV12_SCOMX|nr:Toll-like receptor 2 type-1 [Scophthalmus maximus]
MEPVSSLETPDSQSQAAVPLSPNTYVPPTLRGGECYHVFISYSSTDYQWTHSVINQLESCGLQVCYHERDFTPGRTVLENMSDCIQKSQKVLLVLSPEFVRSRWCLLEANMSLFRDCLERKPIVPVLLQPGVSVPLHLCHLTYLEANDPDLMNKLLKVLCTPNQQLQGSTVVPFQPPSIYNGKALQPLTAVNDEGLNKWDTGRFSDMEVPDQLRLIIEDQETYRSAVRMINSVSQNKKDDEKYIVREMQKAMGQANAILSEEKLLVGCRSNSKMYLVYVSLDDCKHEFAETFTEQIGAEDMFQRALTFFSSGYACCLAKRHFPFPQPSSTSHLEGGIMEPVSSLETPDSQSQAAVPLSPNTYVPPTLRGGECYHVFISYSSTDYQWTHSVINQLESCGLQVCYHERDFTPGRTVLENMSDCIQESQKVLLVLSPEFVRSRWCLLEANMSLFRDCLERKPIVPVLLQPGVSVPLHLCHLTYLEANDPDLMNKLLKVLCTPNQQLQGSTVVPFQPPSIYNGKALQPLTAVNDEGLNKWDTGRFSDMEVPDQLRLIIEDQETYRSAVRMINSVSQNKKDDEKYIVREMQKAMGQANAILSEEKLLVGCRSNSKMYLVYVSLDDCKHEFAETFTEQIGAEDMFQRALTFFSSGYACCLAKRHFPFPQPSSTGHLEGGVCFCQYVSQQLSRGEWA